MISRPAPEVRPRLSARLPVSMYDMRQLAWPAPRSWSWLMPPGVSVPAAQTAISRLIDRQVLEASQASSLHVPHAAQQMFERGARRIFTPRANVRNRPAVPGGLFRCPRPWRSLRHQIRKHFLQLGGRHGFSRALDFPGVPASRSNSGAQRPGCQGPCDAFYR